MSGTEFAFPSFPEEPLPPAGPVLRRAAELLAAVPARGILVAIAQAADDSDLSEHVRCVMTQRLNTSSLIRWQRHHTTDEALAELHAAAAAADIEEP